MALWRTESVPQAAPPFLDPAQQYRYPANAGGLIQQIAPDGAVLDYPRRIGNLTASTPVNQYQLEAQGSVDPKGHKLLRTTFPRTLIAATGGRYVAASMDEFLVALNLGYSDAGLLP